MKKNFTIFLSLLLSVTLQAQNFTNKDKALIFSRVDSLLISYMEKSTLTEPGKTKLSDKVVQDFRKLFALEAMVFDDINASFVPDGKNYPYKLTSKSRNDYIYGLVDDFEAGLMINNRRININYSNYSNGIITAALERDISGINKTKKYILSTHDTLLITIGIQKDKSVKITKVEALGNPQVKIKNDMDLDGVVDEIDACKTQAGKIDLQGCPDGDDDGIADRNDDCPDIKGTKENGGCPASTFAYRYVLTGGIGVQLNNMIVRTPALNDLAYSSLDKSNRSDAGEVVLPGVKPSVALNVNLAYYFGKKKNNRNKGISIGFAATNFKSTFEMKNIKYEFKSNDGGNNYRRIVTLDRAKEDLSFSMINIPLLFRFKEKFNAKAGFELFAGPSFISFITNSTFNAVFDFEGIYQLNDQGVYDFNPVYNPQVTDLNITEGGIANYLSASQVIDGRGPEELFGLLNSEGYDFALNKEFKGKDNKIQTHFGIALNVGADLFYHVTKNLAVKGGANLVIAPLNSGNSDPYIMVDRSNGDYNSIYKSKANSTYTALGFNLGIILGI